MGPRITSIWPWTSKNLAIRKPKPPAHALRHHLPRSVQRELERVRVHGVAHQLLLEHSFTIDATHCGRQVHARQQLQDDDAQALISELLFY